MMYLRDHMAEEVTIEELAQLAHLSPSHLIRTFSKSVGVSPIRYLQNIRIDAAKSLLMATNLDVGEVSAAVGFGSPKYFWRVFAPPRACRRAISAAARRFALPGTKSRIVHLFIDIGRFHLRCNMLQ